jgi:hypothetical protein
MSQILEWFNQNPWAIWIILIIVILILLWLILRHTTSSSSQGEGRGNSGNGNSSGSGGGNNSNSNGNAGDSSGAGGASNNGSDGEDADSSDSESSGESEGGGSGNSSGGGSGSKNGDEEESNSDESAGSGSGAGNGDSGNTGATAAEMLEAIEREQEHEELMRREHERRMWELRREREAERQARMMMQMQGSGNGVGSSAGNSELDWGNDIRTSRKVPGWVYVMNRSIARKASRKRANGDQVKTYQRHNPRSMRFSNVIRPRTLTISKPDKLSVYVGVDTSGSMRSHNGSRLAVEAVDQILRQDKYETQLACIDTKLYPWQSAENLKNIRFTGGGGTYLSTFFKEVLNIDRNPTEETPKPDVAVLITDGELEDEDWAEMTKQASLYDNKGISMFVLITDPRVSCPSELRNLAKVFHSTK